MLYYKAMARRTKQWSEQQTLKCANCDFPYSKGSIRCNLCRGLKGYLCPDCGKEISHQGKHVASRCSSCARRHSWATGDMYKGVYPTGENNPNWKGGRFTNRDGYVFVSMPEHHRAYRNGYVLEHILVWEQTHGKPLPKGWIIHHLNGIKDDNRPGNLIGLPNKKHYLVLQAKAKRIQELEALLNNQHQLL